MQQKIIILDFGSQTTQLIGRRVRELDTFCEILPYNKFPVADESVIGVILSGSPYSVHDPQAFKVDLSQFVGKVPVLGICYGAQFIAHTNGGKVEKTNTREYGRAQLCHFDQNNPLFKDFTPNSQVWMSHGDTITQIPDVETTVNELREQLGNDRVILGLSGGVDSSVCATLLNKAIGKNLTCIFVDHGMLRKNEFQKVMEAYEGLGLNVIGVDASEKFFKDLEGVTDPEQKRKIIGRDFVEVFNAEAKKITDAKWLAQGTIYPDRIESLSITGMVIKSHHNVGGLPKEMHLQLCEPLKWLFKDEVRRVGYQLQMPERLIKRHPFPGPGLAVRILGDITREKVAILQEADDIYIESMLNYRCDDGEVLYDKVWQAGAVLLSTIRSVGVMGDERTYEHPVALRAVTSTDAMTADWAHLPYDFLAKVSNEIINKVRGVNRVCYDISSKPPSTIEWE